MVEMPNEMEALELEDVASLLGVSERMVVTISKTMAYPARVTDAGGVSFGPTFGSGS